MKEYYIKSKQNFLSWTEEYKDKMNYGIEEWMKGEDQFFKKCSTVTRPAYSPGGKYRKRHLCGRVFASLAATVGKL